MQSPSPVAVRPLRLLIVNYEFPPFGGGASFASFGLARTLVSRGHSVDVLTSRLKGQPEVESIEGMRIHRVTSWRRGMHECGLRGAATFVFFGLLRLRKLMATEHYDLVHYFFGLPCGLLSLYSHGVHRVPYVISLRGSDVPSYDPTDRSLNSMHQIFLGLSRHIWRKARGVIPNSTGLRDLAASFDPSIQYEVIPNAVVDSVSIGFKPTSPTAAVKIICVARLIERKGLGTLLCAMQKVTHRNVELHIVGGGKDEQRLRSLAQDMGLASKVIFHGALMREAVLDMCEKSDIFVLPTLSESCSMALLEGMSRGLPVVTTRVGGNPFLIQDGVQGLLVAPGDSDELADALDALIGDPARRQAMGRANTVRIAREFTWAINAERFETTYQRALTQRPD